MDGLETLLIGTTILGIGWLMFWSLNRSARKVRQPPQSGESRTAPVDRHRLSG